MALRSFWGWAGGRLGGRLGGRALAAARADAQLARDRLRDVLDAIPEGIVILDAEGRYVLWNRRYEEIYHRSADLFRPGEKLIDTLRVGVERGDYPEAVGREEAWLEARTAKLMSATGQRHEQRVADGRWLMIEERRTSEGGIIGLRVDITDLKGQAQALEDALAHAEAANRAKTEFLADMSHELRTPLNGVLGLARVLESTDLTPPQRELLAELRHSAGALETLVRDLLDYGEADLAPDIQAGEQLRAAAGSPIAILLADDNATNRKVIELMLAAAGVAVTSVENGRSAVEAWRKAAFDVVLMDLRMPIMDGLTAIRQIREFEAARGRGRTAIVVISANTGPEDRQASAEAGADAHIGKPIKIEELLGAIERALAG